MADVDPEVEAVWDEFHAVVNMNSRELADWLRLEAADEQGAEVQPHKPVSRDAAARGSTGERVLHILSQRKADVDAADVAVMREVIDLVRSERGEELEPTAGDADWRHRLMSVGHDPLKP
jgi:hypothetical protein